MKILLWNLQDFFVFLDKLPDDKNPTDLSEPHWQLASSSFKENKSLQHVQAMADLIQNIQPDLCLFTEVGGRESLENLNLHFLESQFKSIHYTTNSDRGIDLGILASKKLEFLGDKIYRDRVFSRGVLELRLQWEDTKLCFLLTHLKSKLDKEKKDFEGRGKRKEEVSAIIKIAQRRKKQDHNVIVCGDLNGVIYEDQTEPELNDFAKYLGLKDVLEWLKVPVFERSTYLYYNHKNDMIPMQLDYVLVDAEMAKLLSEETCVVNFEGNPRLNFPKSLAEKRMHPSDHYPLVVKLKSS